MWATAEQLSLPAAGRQAMWAIVHRASLSTASIPKILGIDNSGCLWLIYTLTMVDSGLFWLPPVVLLSRRVFFRKSVALGLRVLLTRRMFGLPKLTGMSKSILITTRGCCFPKVSRDTLIKPTKKGG